MISPRFNCQEIVERLWPYLDGALPDEERERVVQHLESCEACTSHFDYAQAFLEAVHGSDRTDAKTDALRARVLAALSAEGFSAS